MIDYYGWVRKNEIVDVILRLHESYVPIDSETIHKSFFIGAQDSLEVALEQIVGKEKATQLILESIAQRKIFEKGLFIKKKKRR